MKELFYPWFVSPGGCKTRSCKISSLCLGLLHTDRLREYFTATILKKASEMNKLIVSLNRRAVGRRDPLFSYVADLRESARFFIPMVSGWKNENV